MKLNNTEFIDQVRQAHHHGQAAEKYHNIGRGSYLRNMVYGANDGIVTTFAVVAGVAGANLAPKIVLILGFANLVADGMAMAIGNYLGTKSENQFKKIEEKMEIWEIEHVPEDERKEIEDIYRAKGFSGNDLERAVSIITANKTLWAHEMMVNELGIIPGDGESPWKNGLATFIAFGTAGLLPMLPYVFGLRLGSMFNTAIVTTAGALFVVGSLRAFMTKRHWFISGLEMLLVGAIAAAAAYGLGYWIEMIA